MFDRFLLLWLLLISALAYFWPAWAPAALPDPFLATKAYVPWMIAATMFSVGAMLPRDEVRQVRERWAHVLFGTAIQYSAMPLLGWGVARLSGLGTDLQIGMILVGCVPGAMASNVLTMNARGHVSYSVSLTTAATLLSPLVVPLTLKLALGKTVPLDVWDVSRSLLLQVVLPVLVGYSVTRVWSNVERLGHRCGPFVANCVILWIIATVVAVNRQHLAGGSLPVIGPLLAINVLGYLAGWWGSSLIRMPESMRRALTIEVGMQNAGLGTSLAFKLFPDLPAVAVPTALYTFGCVVTASLLASYWSRAMPRE